MKDTSLDTIVMLASWQAGCDNNGLATYIHLGFAS